MVIRKRWYIFPIFIFICSSVNTQTVYETKIQSNQVKALQLKTDGQPHSMPVINLDGGLLEINFDILNYSRGRYAYSITYCDADWKKSSLSPIEYMNGYQGMIIEDYAQSIATTTLYRNYRLFLPNDDVKFKLSGNYIVEVYEEDDPQRVLFTARFAVIESLIDIVGSINTHTDIDFNKEHQQLEFEVDYRKFPIAYPQNDLKIFVYQDSRIDNVRTGFQPQSMTGNKSVYRNVRELLFEAGNEYRRIEFLTHRFSGMGVERIQYFNPYYHADLMIDNSRSNQIYQYDQDQNGRFYVNCNDCNDPGIEADYYVVHFGYKADLMPKGDIYLNGDLVQNQLGENSRMEYNSETGLYEKALLLKQGLYNYQYLYVPQGESQATVALTEGNYYQAENEYTVFVYYRPMGGRYDRLIGKRTIRNM